MGKYPWESWDLNGMGETKVPIWPISMRCAGLLACPDFGYCGRYIPRHEMALKNLVGTLLRSLHKLRWDISYSHIYPLSIIIHPCIAFQSHGKSICSGEFPHTSDWESDSGLGSNHTWAVKSWPQAALRARPCHSCDILPFSTNERVQTSKPFQLNPKIPTLGLGSN